MNDDDSLARMHECMCHLKSLISLLNNVANDTEGGSLLRISLYDAVENVEQAGKHIHVAAGTILWQQAQRKEDESE